MRRIVLIFLSVPLFLIYVVGIFTIGFALSANRKEHIENLTSAYVLSCVLNAMLTILLIAQFF